MSRTRLQGTTLPTAVDSQIAVSSKTSTPYTPDTSTDSESQPKPKWQTSRVDWGHSQEDNSLKILLVTPITNHYNEDVSTVYSFPTFEQLDKQRAHTNVNSVLPTITLPTIDAHRTQISSKGLKSTMGMQIQVSSVYEDIWVQTALQSSTVPYGDKPDRTTEQSIQYEPSSHSNSAQSKSSFGVAIAESLAHRLTNGLAIATANTPLATTYAGNPFKSSSNISSNAVNADRLIALFPSQTHSSHQLLRLSETTTETILGSKNAFLEPDEPKELQAILPSSFEESAMIIESALEAEQEDKQFQKNLSTTTSDFGAKSIHPEAGNDTRSATISSQSSSLILATGKIAQTITDSIPTSQIAPSQSAAEVRTSTDGTGASNPITGVFMEVVLSSVGSASLLILLIFVLHGPCYRLLQRMRTSRNIDITGQRENNIQDAFSDSRDVFHEVSRFSEDS